MTQAIPSDSSEVDLRVRDKNHISQSDPRSRLNQKIAQRVVDYLQPKSLLLLHPHEGDFDVGFHPRSLNECFTGLDVKVSTGNVSNINGASNSFDLVLFMAPEAQDFSDIESALNSVATRSPRILFLTQKGYSSNKSALSAAEHMSALTSSLFDAGFMKDPAFSLPFIGSLGALYIATKKEDVQVAAKKMATAFEKEHVALSLERDRIFSGELSKAAASQKIAADDPIVGNLVSTLLDRERLIKKLRSQISEVSQQMYMARDAVAGAEAEKASATAETSELHYHIHVKNNELKKLIAELDSEDDFEDYDDVQETEAAQEQPEEKSLKQELKEFKTLRIIAKLIAPLRRKIAER